jgi:hypothetical protein
MYKTATVPLTAVMRAELERLARGPGIRWRLMARYAFKSGVYAGLGMSAVILLGYGLAQTIQHVFPSANCKPGALRLTAALPIALVAVAVGAWVSGSVWRHKTAVAATAQKDLAVGLCQQISLELTSRHVLAFDDGVFLFVPAADGKTFVVAADSGDPRAIALADAQGGRCGSQWRWLCAPETEVVSDLEVGGEQIQLMDGIWLEGSTLWDKLEDHPSDGTLLDLPFEQVEQLVREAWDADNKGTVQSGRVAPSATWASRLFLGGRTVS